MRSLIQIVLAVALFISIATSVKRCPKNQSYRCEKCEKVCGEDMQWGNCHRGVCKKACVCDSGYSRKPFVECINNCVPDADCKTPNSGFKCGK